VTTICWRCNRLTAPWSRRNSDTVFRKQRPINVISPGIPFTADELFAAAAAADDCNVNIIASLSSVSLLQIYGSSTKEENQEIGHWNSHKHALLLDRSIFCVKCPQSTVCNCWQKYDVATMGDFFKILNIGHI